MTKKLKKEINLKECGVKLAGLLGTILVKFCE